MRRPKILALAVVLTTALAGFPAQADFIGEQADFIADQADFIDDVVGELRSMGYAAITVERTLLGRVRIMASDDRGYREIIVNPRTGEILRDLFVRTGSGGGNRLLGNTREDGDGDDEDDDTDDDDRDSRSGSGGGSGGSGSGGDSGGGNSDGNDDTGGDDSSGGDDE